MGSVHLSKGAESAPNMLIKCSHVNKWREQILNTHRLV